MKRGTLLLRLLVALMLPAMAAQAADIKGLVVDDTGEPLPAATIRLLAARDSSYVRGAKTNSSGRYTFSGVRSGKYIVEAAYVGLARSFVDVKVADQNVTAPKIAMSQTSIMLKEVSVTGVKTQIKVKEDTVEFNADSYKTQPNAVVEDLLKRLPGVEVDADGKITANGKEVAKILIDGKEFFSDDPKVASKNLPVNMIDKLQVVDRKSDLARLTGVDDGEDETVINLTVKKGMKNGYFGTAEAGYGTSGRYKGSFNVNKFWNENQVTLLGNFNNINELGFTDSNGNRFRRFGGTNGINKSQALGLNFNVGRGETFRVGGDIMYSHSDRNSYEHRDRQYLFTDSTSYSLTDRRSRDRGHNVRADFRLEWKPDSFNTIDFRPNFSWNYNKSASIDSTLISAGDALRTPVSNSFNDQSSDGRSFEFGGRLIYTHNFRRRRGRSFSAMINYRHSNVQEDAWSYARNRFYLLGDSLDIYDQTDDNHTWSDFLTGRLSWTEPLGDVAKGNFLTFSYQLRYRWNNADKMVYDHPVITDPATGLPAIDYSQEIFNEELSNRFRNDYFNQELRIGYRHVSKTHNLDAGISLQPSMSLSENLINDAKSIPRRWVWNYSPFLRYRLKMGKQRSLMLNYGGRSSQPSMNQLQPVADVSDPMNIIVGNPSLDPTFTHNIRLRFQDFNQDHQRSVMVMSDVQVTQNSIVSRTSFDPTTGGRTTTYENVNGVWNARLMAILSQPLRNKAFQVSLHTFGMYNRRVGFNNGERNSSGNLMLNFMPAISYRPDNLELELRPRYSLQLTRNSLQSVGNRTVHNYGGTFTAYYRTPIGVILNSDLTYTATSGYAEGFDKNEWMWNASIAYEFLRDKSLTVSLKAYDLLQQQTNITRSVTANYIDDSSYNNLTRYFMLTVSYRFNTFGKGNQPADRNARRFGPGGPPPHRH